MFSNRWALLCWALLGYSLVAGNVLFLFLPDPEPVSQGVGFATGAVFGTWFAILSVRAFRGHHDRS